MVSRKEKLEQSSSVNNDGDKHSNSAKQLNVECTGNQSSSLIKISNVCKEVGDGGPNKLADIAVEQGAPLGKGKAKPAEVPVITAAAAAVTHLPNKTYKRKHFGELLTENTVASSAGEKKLQEEGEEGGSVASGDEHAAAAIATDRPLLQLTADALLPDGGIRSITTEIKKRGKTMKLSTTDSLGGQTVLETELLPVEAALLKDGWRVSSTPRKRKGKPHRLTIGTINDLPAEGHSSLRDASQVDESRQVHRKKKANEETLTTTSSSSKAIIQWNGSSPFMKRSPIWKAIESMQVFHKFPQNPHFLPLFALKDDSREGLAIGHMVTFANVVEKAFQLNHTQDLTTCLDTLQDLEHHGFDVTAVRDHLRKMLAIKEVQEKLREKKKQVENRILELIHEHPEIDKEILEVNEKMKRLQEKIALAKSKKGGKLSEIVSLKGQSASISQLINEADQNVEDPAEYYLKMAPFIPSFPPLG